MPRKQTNFLEKVKQLLAHVAPLPVEAASPLPHYRRTSTDLWNAFLYIGRNLDQLKLHQDLYDAVLQKHLSRVNGMILVNLIETFERYLKESAALCVNSIAQTVLDDRFDTFKVRGSSVAAHFHAETLGQSLCESATWLNCDDINARFRDLLADPFEPGQFVLFPKRPVANKERFETLSIIWQVRHTLVHNVGVITHSDAIKLRVLARADVEPERVISPTRDDLYYVKRFLDETAEWCNAAIGNRLATLLTRIHSDSPGIFAPQEKANGISQQFGFSLTIDGNVGIP